MLFFYNEQIKVINNNLDVFDETILKHLYKILQISKFDIILFGTGENLKKFKKLDTVSLLNKSINETLSRTINTTATTILALLALFIFGGNIIKDFSLAMIWGIVIGTYSSILIATPILLNMKIRKANKESEE